MHCSGLLLFFTRCLFRSNNWKESIWFCAGGHRKPEISGLFLKWRRWIEPVAVGSLSVVGMFPCGHLFLALSQCKVGQIQHYPTWNSLWKCEQNVKLINCFSCPSCMTVMKTEQTVLWQNASNCWSDFGTRRMKFCFVISCELLKFL